MSHRKSEDAIFLIGGALLGAAAIYVLDPQTGAKRRERIVAAAENAREQARGMMESALHRASNSAGVFTGGLADKAQTIAADLAHRAREALPETREAARSWGSHLFDRARTLRNRLHSSLHDRAQDVHDEAANRVNNARDWAAGRTTDARRRVANWIAPEESHGFGTGTLLSSTAGCLAVGAGLMYFFDPQRGRTRRTRISDKTSQCIRNTGKTLRATGRDLSNRLRGKAHETASAARNYVSEAQIDSQELIARIRSEMGHVADRLGNIQFMADAAGTVTVTGNIVRNEADELLTVLHKVPGVAHVINRLNVSDASQPTV